MGGRRAPARADCQAMLEELFGYLDGEMSEARCRKIERHLDACPCCGYLAIRVRRAIAVCRLAGRTTLPPGVRREAKTRIAHLLSPRSPSSGLAARPRRGSRRPAASRPRE